MIKVNIAEFSYQKSVVLRHINFTTKPGNIVGVIGESGCGKSTLLKLIYGLYDVDFGSIYWKEIPILGPKYNLVPGMDFMKYLAQDFDLMPFITVGENVGKYLSNVDKEKKQTRINELLNLVEMAEFKNTKAQFLSGGQMQRVALAKVLAQEPEVLLLDEPFSHIDNFRKNKLRRQIFAYLKQQNITTFIASHDANDFLSFTDEVLVMKNGEIIEINSPIALYNNPQNYYTSSLFDEVNQIEMNDKTVLVYPHELVISEDFDFKVKVKNCYFKGNYYLIEALHLFNEKTIFFKHVENVKNNEIIGLKIV